MKEYGIKYRQRPEVIARSREYEQRPEVKAKRNASHTAHYHKNRKTRYKRDIKS